MMSWRYDTMKTYPSFYNHIPDICLFMLGIFTFIVSVLFPSTKIIIFPYTLAGWAIVLIGFMAVFYILSHFKSWHTSTNPIDKPSEFIVDGLFSLTRNPLYVTYVTILVGCALAFGSWITFIAPPLCFFVISRLIIPIEEKIMERQFGERYKQYKKSVRRWL